MIRPILLILPLVIGGCAASPLYVDRGETRGTMAEIPRDARGEPLWAAIKPIPAMAGEPQRDMTAFRR